MSNLYTRLFTFVITAGPLAAVVCAQPGSNDPTFLIGSGFGGAGTQTRVHELVVLPDDKVLVGGTFTSFNGVPCPGLIRLEANGTRDIGFPNGSGINGTVTAFDVLPDGRIIVAGSFSSVNGVPRMRLARLFADGTLDPSFDPGGGLSSFPDVVAHQLDGKVLIGGNFNTYDGTPVNSGLVRINADGSLDDNFSAPTWPPYGVSTHSVAVQPDGKVLMGATISGTSAVNVGIVRLHPDGSLDPTFNSGGQGLERIGGGSVFVTCIVVQPDDRIVLGGLFYTYNGVPRQNIVRLEADGQLDISFTPGTGVNNDVTSIALRLDGSMVIGGVFTEVNSVPCRSLALLDDNGIRISSFDPGMGVDAIPPFDNGIQGVALQADGRIIIGGEFTQYNGAPRNHIARVIGDCSVGAPCDDGDDCTIGDVFDADCLCIGTFQDADGDGTCDAFDLCPGGPEPGSACDDGNANTVADVITAECICLGNSCLPTQLTTTADPVISCGAVNLKMDGSSTIAATDVPGANKYQFRFTNIPGQPNYARNIAFPTRSFGLTKWYTNPLKAGRTYNVVVRASFDDGITWCDWGPSCTVKVDWFPLSPGMVRSMEEGLSDVPELLLYPNPTNGEQLRFTLSGADPLLTTATLDMFDLFGKRVMTATLPMQDGGMDTVLPLGNAISAGMYVVTITAGDHVFNERLVIAR